MDDINVDFFQNIIDNWTYNEVKNITYKCYNCYGTDDLIHNKLNDSYDCPLCGNSTYTIDTNPMKLKSYHSDFHKFITKKMNKINSMFPLDEQLEPFELHQLINMYIDIRIIIHSVTGRKNNFIIHFFISRLLQFIDKHNLVKYVDCSLSKLTYNKYCTQWLSICNHINQKFNMDNIHIKQYPFKKYQKIKLHKH